METIDIVNLNEYISNSDSLIVGSPKGVGFSTYISELIAHYMFFNDEYSILVLTDSRKSKIDILFRIQKAYENFGIELQRNGDILYTESEIGSGVCVINYDEYKLKMIEDNFDMVIVDKDDFSNFLYSHFVNLKEHSKKIIFNTYDLPHSIFYNVNLDKIILRSKYSDENIQKNYGKHPNIINYDRVLLGEFKQ